VEVERVEAGLAVDRVIAVARIPDERVVAGAEERSVGAFTAVRVSSPAPPKSMSSPRRR
jgi:hypothetical protein